MIKDKKILIGKLSFLIIIVLMLGWISLSRFTVKADVSSKPAFTVSIDSYTPTNPSVGEDITIHGTITPQPFQMAVPAKEIVLVLDTSGSMADPKTGNINDSKIEKLKVAAKNFVDTMKNESNLKIGIVTFSTNSNINEALIPASNVTELNRVINGLKANGGTNTGEGLRRAAYLLYSSNNSAANKTIVFMSDGEPTYYNGQTNKGGWKYGNYSGKYYEYYGWYFLGGSYFIGNYGSDDNHTPSGYDYRKGPYEGNYEGYKYQNSYNSYYTDITKSEADDNLLKGTGYSDDNGYCLEYAKEIGEIIKARGYNAFSISYGLDDSGNAKMQQIHNSMSGNSSNFFTTGTDAINGVFNTIASTLKDTYTISNINFNFNFNDGAVIEAVGGNTIRLNDITYKKGPENNGVSTYTSPPIPFTITIKSKIPGDGIPVLSNSTITFPWNSETVTTKVPATTINVKDNNLPGINVDLASVEQNPCKFGDSVKITYNIIPQDFVYSDMSSQLIPKDVVILLDTSAGMNDGDKLGTFKNAVWNNLLNNSIFNNKPMKYGLVTYNSNAIINQDLTTNKTQLNDNVIKNITLSTSNERNIGLALEKANEILQKDTSDAKKYIILISSGNVNYTETQVNNIRNNGYKVLSLALGNTNDVNTDPSPTLNQLATSLGGTSQDYFISVKEGNNNATQNYVMNNLANRINDDFYKTYNFSDIKLNLDLNGNFDAVSGLSGSGDKRSIAVPSVEYKNNNGVWHAESTSISFTIKPNKLGHLSFKENTDINNLANTISYTGINKSITRAINTPTIDVISPIIVNHGIYGGIDNESKNPIIEPSNDKTFPKKAIVPMAISFDFYTSTTIKLELDKNRLIDGNIKVYKVNGGTLSKIAEINNNNSSTYDIPIGDGLTNGDKILILYNSILPDRDDYYTNSVTVGSASPVYAILNVKGNLPDLF